MKYDIPHKIEKIDSSFLDAFIQFVAVLDLQGRLAKVNRQALDVAALDLSAVQGKFFWECHWWTYDPSVQASIKSAFHEAKNGKSTAFEIEARGEGERKVGVDFKLSPVYEEGELIYLLASGTDITSRKQTEFKLKRKESEFKVLADSMPQLAWMADRSGYIFWYNQRWYDYTGTKFEQMQGWGWQKVHSPNHVDRVVKKITKSFQSGTFWEDTFPLRAKDGSFRWFLSRAIPIKDDEGEVYRWFGTNTDITDELEAQNRLKELSDKLATENQNKDLFLATLSHEIRNPLNAISMGIELIAQGNEIETAVFDQSVAAVQRQINHLSVLFDDLMDFSRINTGKLKLKIEKVDLQDCLRQSVENNAARIAESNHKLEVAYIDSPVEVEADPTRLTQIFSNLLNNAAKYTPEGGQIKVCVNASTDKVEVSFEDTGIGIAQVDQERIFNIFIQSHTVGDKPNAGLGLGLTLVKELTQSFQGTVEVTSDGKGKGSKFTVFLPRIKESLQKEQKLTDPAEISSSLTILIAEDNLDSNRLFQLMLKNSAREILSAEDGLTAVNLAKEHSPDVILLDIGMPQLTGLEAVKQIRELSWQRRPLIIAISGWGQPEDIEKSHRAGFDLHLTKPVNFQKLRTTIKNFATSRED